MSKDFMARIFIQNPGGAYDPAPLNEFDAYPGSFVPAVGDVIRYNGSSETLRVVARFYDVELNRAALYVERWSGEWPSEI